MAGMIRKTLATTSAAMLVLSAPFAIAAEGWTMDFAAAKATAAEHNKDLFLEFTGSDWCPPCQMLNREVFSKEEFVKGAAEHFVLVKLDFPQNEALLTEEIRKQNEELSEKFGIESFPTILLCDAQGRPYASTGFREGGPADYLEHIATLREIRTKRDAGFEAANSAEGLEKAKILFSTLNAMDMDFKMLLNFYADEIAIIKANDPDDETGFAKKSAAQKRLDEFNTQINALAQNDDFEGVLPLVDEILKVEGFEPAEIQQITLTRAIVFAQLGRFDEAIKVVEEAEKIAPDSEVAPFLEGFKAQLAEARDAKPEEE